MRVVSWVVVAASVGWLIAFNLRTVVDADIMPAISTEQVTGTVAATTGPTHHFQDFARSYTAAWNAHNPALVASHYAADGRIIINNGEPYVGVSGLSEMADGFITTFPDIRLTMDSLEDRDGKLVYQWTFTGTHFETGHKVRITGSETWTLSGDGLIADSTGQFDGEDYALQVAHGYQP